MISMCSASQPSLLAEVAGDAQGQALLAQQHVAAVAGADAPDGVVLGEVQDQPALDVQVGLAVQALGELAAGAELLRAPACPTWVMIRMFSTT